MAERMWKAGILVWLLACSTPSLAADLLFHYSIMGAGTQSCGKYLEDRDGGTRGSLRYMNWLGGYFTAYNLYEPNTYDISGDHDLPALMAWLDKYCREHPLDTFNGAVQALAVELYPARQKSSPP